MTWALMAAGLAVTAEYLYRVVPGPWARWLWLWVPLQLGIGYGVYRMVTGSASLVDAFVVWTVAVMGLRVGVSVVVLGDTVAGTTWTALGLVGAARIVQWWGGR